MHHSALPWLAGIAATIVLAGAYFVVTASAPTHTVKFGEPIRQDDFDYSVAGLVKTKMLGTGSAKVHAGGTFYVVTIQVDNRALRVDYRWDPTIARVVDASGREYPVSLRAQAAIDAGNPRTPIVDHGDSAQFQVAFDLPADVNHPALAFSNGILMGDVFNEAYYSKARVPLD